MSGSPMDSASTSVPGASQAGASGKTGSLMGSQAASLPASLRGGSSDSTTSMLVQLMQMLSRSKGG